MSRGTNYGTERIDRVDSVTGLKVRQITSFPLPSLHMHYETPTFTPDGTRMILVTLRSLHRNAPWDLITCQSDGMNLVRLNSDAETGASNCCLSVDGEHALYMEGATAYRSRLDNAEYEEIGRVDGADHHAYYRGARTPDGRWYFALVRRNSRLAVVRFDLKTGDATIVVEADGVNHPKANPGGSEIRYGLKYRDEGGVRQRTVYIDADTLEEINVSIPAPTPSTAHATWLGESGNWVGTLKPPGRAIVLLDREHDRIETLAEGPYFWHCGASEDGNWVIADTNWPDEGLWLINVATKRGERLCYAGASQGHPQMTHTHPNLNNDGSMAVFTSDRTGVTQVYTVGIPDELRARLSGNSAD